MKVLVLASLYYPMTGGAETYIRLLAEGLAAQGHKVAVITDGSRLPGEQAHETLGGVEVIRLRDFAVDEERALLRQRRDLPLLDRNGIRTEFNHDLPGPCRFEQPFGPCTTSSSAWSEGRQENTISACAPTSAAVCAGMPPIFSNSASEERR